MDTKSAFGSIYFTILGIAALFFGIWETLIAITPMKSPGGFIDMSGMFLVWRGVILICAALFYLSSVTNFLDIRQLAKSVMAGIMIWIIAGMEIWGRIAASIPGGEGGAWFNPPADFLATYAPPYMPELYLLPFSLVIIYYISKRKSVSRA